MQAESCDAFIFRSEMKARASEGTAAQFDLCDVVIELAEVPWQGEPLVSPKADTAALRLHANQVEGKLTCAQSDQPPLAFQERVSDEPERRLSYRRRSRSLSILQISGGMRPAPMRMRNLNEWTHA